MDFSLNGDRLAVQEAIEKIAYDFTSVPTDFHDFALTNADLDERLTENGFWDIAVLPEMGPLSAALAVETLARLPCTVEAPLSMLLNHLFDGALPRPIALVEDGRPGRFVHGAKTLIIRNGLKVGIAHPQAGDTEALPASLYAYPMGRVIGELNIEWVSEEQAAAVTTWLRIALASEMAGLLKASVDAAVEHVSTRKQFGRPIGTFQALRHRLAECTVLAGGVRWLALQAAWSGDSGDAALAALHAQESGSRIVYDVHQMCGAMGMTLEMNLHLWTYRVKYLLSELGGRAGNATSVADTCFEGLDA